MRKSLLAALLAASCLGSYGVVPAQAATIPYPHAGTQNSALYNFTATATGNIEAYFYGSSAADIDLVGLLVNGIPTGITGLNNQTSHFGDSIDLGNVTAGDKLTFILINQTTGHDWYSRRHLNSDHSQHVYSTPYSGSGVIPAGTYVGFEDLPKGSNDWDYNDLQFVFVDVDPPATPLPAALPLFAGGLGVISLLSMRRKRKNAASAAV